jgi:hypothetical protein
MDENICTSPHGVNMQKTNTDSTYEVDAEVFFEYLLEFVRGDPKAPCILKLGVGWSCVTAAGPFTPYAH